MNYEDLININGIREDLYQAMQIGDITLSFKHSQELYDFMNYQDKEIERLNNIINELYALVGKQLLSNTNLTNYTDEKCLNDIYDKLKELKENK